MADVLAGSAAGDGGASIGEPWRQGDKKAAHPIARMRGEKMTYCPEKSTRCFKRRAL
ncbi:hypothetical protein [Slackia piriformis]